MANIKVSELPLAGPITGNEELLGVQSGASVKIQTNALKALGSEVYATEALGRAAVIDGACFKVAGSGNVAVREYRRTNATTSVLVSESLGTAAVTTTPTANKSPLAGASGKIANGWLDLTAYTTSDQLSLTPAPNKVPKADANGKIGTGWMDLTAYAKNEVISVTPSPDKVPKSNASGKIDSNWIDQTIFIKDPLRQSVEAASGGSYTVVYTPNGQPSFLFRQPAYNLEDVAPGGELGTGLHPAFIFNGIPEREIFVGAYPAAMVNGEVVCQPGRDPANTINFVNARAACQALGAGWDIMSNWDWAAIALWCMANGFQPRGNTNYGRNHENRWETGTRVVDDIPGSSTNTNGRTLTGSGPAGWSHNNTPGGIHDLVGNVWEWNQGLILDDNIFKVAPDNGTYLESEFIDTAYAAAATGTFSTRTYVDPPLILKQALAVPASASLAPTGNFTKNAEGLRLLARGGTWAHAGNAGLGAFSISESTAAASIYFGFRPRFRAI